MSKVKNAKFFNKIYLVSQDDGKSYDNEKGAYCKRIISYDPSQNQLKFSAVEGSFSGKFTHILLVLHEFDKGIKLRVDGVDAQVSETRISLLNPVSKFDPQGREGYTTGSHVLQTLLNNSNKAMQIEIK